jgi:nitroreductase
MTYAETARKRRAVNFFDPDKPVSSELLRQVVELAALAPSGFNLQPWSLMVLREQEEKMKLRKLAWDQPKISDAPVVLMVLADRNGWREGTAWFERNFQEMKDDGSMGEDRRDWFVNACKSLYGRSDEAALAFAVKNAGFFSMALMYSAVSLGLDCHPMDGFDHDGVKEAFNIPDQYWIPLLLAVGYFDGSKQLLPAKWRKSYDELVVTF